MRTPLTDFLGTSFTPDPDARILSLVPSLTELCFDLGLGDLLVGRTHYCIHPKQQITSIPSVGGTKKIKMDRVQELAPTHALLNVDENPKDMAEALRDLGIHVIVTHPMHPDDNIDLYRLIGNAFDADRAAEKLVQAYTSAREPFHKTDKVSEQRVLYLIWKDPWMAISADTYIGNMLGLVNWGIVTPGADPAMTGDAARYPTVRIDDATLADVDLVLFSSEPYSFGDDDISDFRKSFPKHVSKAHLIDGEMTSWYGSRAIHGLAYLRDFADDVMS
ncbi:MAG: helical backbone metal receptor [Rhodospirillales bacterium]